jgi:hypothetical protein
MSTNDHFAFRLTPSAASERMRERSNVRRCPDTIRAWIRKGKLPVLELENGMKLLRPCDVDELAARIAADLNSDVA